MKTTSNRVACIIGLLGFLLICLVPPWQDTAKGGGGQAGYSFLFNPPDGNVLIDMPRMFIGLAILGAVTVGLFFFPWKIKPKFWVYFGAVIVGVFLSAVIVRFLTRKEVQTPITKSDPEDWSDLAQTKSKEVRTPITKSTTSNSDWEPVASVSPASDWEPVTSNSEFGGVAVKPTNAVKENPFDVAERKLKAKHKPPLHFDASDFEVIDSPTNSKKVNVPSLPYAPANP